MARADDEEPADPETTTLNLRVTEQLLADIDVAWKEEGYTSRSEFLRHAIRDAVEHPGLSRDALSTIAAEEYAMRHDEGDAIPRAAVLESLDEE
ncbi:ribbon-helix-helix domain-containing protein [Halobaculum sp. MBLA0147]|uniref:ribbon-helix-helix domain-containing protein n=1 Tax=Halobaculum sp. MBLA0147 TaxID=3079934 RepID=UPI003523E92E